MKNQKLKGFTLLETILYIALLTILVGVLFSYGWNIVSVRIKSAVVRETFESAMLVSERLEREVRSASNIDQQHSVFDQMPGKIVFTTSDGDMVIESFGDKISIKRGNEDAQFLHSDFFRIRNFLLTRQISDSGQIQYVGFSFTAEAYYPGAGDRYEYSFSVPEKGGVEIRSQ
jgi:hypothetical protein